VQEELPRNVRRHLRHHSDWASWPACLLAQTPFVVPIPGTRNIDHLNENLGAINVQLTPADLSEIDTAFSKIKVHGGRMNEEQMRVVDQT
jgi:diketogulonate reductase-like aldo/keto reductase